MRQWHVDPKLLCHKHLLGEHVEHHMFAGSILKGKSLTGYIDDGLVEVHTLIERHAELVREMRRRDYNHSSPLPPGLAEKLYTAGAVDELENLNELRRRCPLCRARIKRLALA